MRLLSFLCSFFLWTQLAADQIVGFWKSVDDETGKPRCVVAIYPYDGKYFGRMIGTYNRNGKISETIYDPKDRAPGIVGDPYYCGLDFIYNLRLSDDGRYKGRIVDPEKGNVYKAELWVRDGNLIVRGKWLFLGKSQTWLPASQKDFPSGFKMPDTAKFVPYIPETK